MEQLFLNLLFAHVVGDFYCQTGRSCSNKRELALKGKDLYIHAFIILMLSWLAVGTWSFWWAALALGVIHLAIDASKALFESHFKMDGVAIYKTRYAVWPFVIDQMLHITVIAVVAAWWLHFNGDWNQFAWLETGWLVTAMAMLLCWKPANLLTKHILGYCQVKVMSPTIEQTDGSDNAAQDATADKKPNFKSGALIGTLERWLIVFFMSIQEYEAIGFLIAAKSILRFSETKESEKSEYVLAGTLVSIAIAVACGCLVLAII